ncbi:MAG: hypothetical protein GX766_03430 [Firmicutes bacterium]|jgi:septal ring factor EnvC (AmiA/AmiB activator)|nr:hypothetical protein [Bacillota bacterium]HQD40493.1 hypothetical protein [Bacillota bacterium]
MRLKMGLLFVFCILCTIPVLADDNLEEQIRQLSVDVPKQQAELAGRLTAAEEEITLLSQQLGALQQQLVDCEAEQQTSSRKLAALEESMSYLKRELELLQLTTVQDVEDNSRIVELEAELAALRKTSLRNLLFVLPAVIGLGIFF